MIEIQDVPLSFLNFNIINYPLHNKSKGIESYFYEYINNENNSQSNLSYLPIQWTSYLIGQDYGKNIKELNDFCKNLTMQYPEKRYFTIVQYAGGPLVEIDNCIVFSSGGMFNTPRLTNQSHINLPLITSPHDYRNKNKYVYKVSYLGRNTHPVRQALEENFSSLEGYSVKNLKSDGVKNKDMKKFRKIMSSSIFSLCPRGYGPASFRFYESLEMGAIPIYVSDKFILPYTDIIDWEKLCLLVGLNDIESIPDSVDKIINSNLHYEMSKYGKYCFEKYFNNNFISKNIIETVSKF